MQCPEDSSVLEPKVVSTAGYNISYVCGICGGEFLSYDEPGRTNLNIGLPESLLYKNLRCPRDLEYMTQEGGHLRCNLCQGIWMPKVESKITEKAAAVGAATKTFVLFFLAVVLFNWQQGMFLGSADSIQTAVETPVKMITILIWFITFILIFLIPASVYMQIVLAHRPHNKKALHHPLVKWLPVIVLIIMAANFYFLSPK